MSDNQFTYLNDADGIPDALIEERLFSERTTRLAAELMTARDSSVFAVLLALSREIDSDDYLRMVIEEATSRWVRWVLHECSVSLVPLALSNFSMFVKAARIVGFTPTPDTEPVPDPQVEQGDSTGRTASTGGLDV